MTQNISNILTYIFLSCVISACAGNVTIQDFQACAIAPGQTGVTCDDFLVNHQVVLTQSEWVAETNHNPWFAISATDLGNIENEINMTCSQLSCSYEQKAAIAQGFERFQAIKAATRPSQP